MNERHGAKLTSIIQANQKWRTKRIEPQLVALARNNMTDEEKEDIKRYYQEADIIFTEHALKRAKERFGFNKEATKRATADAVANGKFYIHTQINEDDIQSYAFVHQNKIFVLGDAINKFTGLPIVVLKTIYPSGKNTEKDKNFKYFVQGKPRITLGTGKRISNARAKNTARKEKKHKTF
jgi:hypothetical protein